MAKFYVFKGKKALWNLFIVVLVIVTLIYVFRVDDGVETEQEVILDQGRGTGNIVVVEPVTVRTVPTKFAEYKLERERMRSRQMELLQNFAYDAQGDPERKGQMQSELQALVEKMSRETEIENLLKAKGYLDGLVILDQDAITVVVPVTLTREEAARIGELVQRMTGVRLEKITIVDEAISV
ncbi:MAG: SpoIIIAH-like family protein [Firmicutes bacterium]|nr:SpoIIIAH-like family protein [Bacillota bacterium]